MDAFVSSGSQNPETERDLAACLRGSRRQRSARQTGSSSISARTWISIPVKAPCRFVDALGIRTAVDPALMMLCSPGRSLIRPCFGGRRGVALPVSSTTHPHPDGCRDAHARGGRRHAGPALSAGLRAAAEERLSARRAQPSGSPPITCASARTLCRDLSHARADRARARDAATRSSLARSIARQFGATQVELAGADGTAAGAVRLRASAAASLAAAWQSLRKDPKREAACVGLDESKSAFVPCGSAGGRPEATLRFATAAAQVLARLPISTGGESGTC
jgi:hypothetical protein